MSAVEGFGSDFRNVVEETNLTIRMVRRKNKVFQCFELYNIFNFEQHILPC